MKGNILRMLNESEKRRIVGMHTSHKNQKLDDEAKRLSKLFGFRINESAIRGHLINEEVAGGNAVIPAMSENDKTFYSYLAQFDVMQTCRTTVAQNLDNLGVLFNIPTTKAADLIILGYFKNAARMNSGLFSNIYKRIAKGKNVKDDKLEKVMQAVKDAIFTEWATSGQLGDVQGEYQFFADPNDQNKIITQGVITPSSAPTSGNRESSSIVDVVKYVNSYNLGRCSMIFDNASNNMITDPYISSQKDGGEFILSDSTSDNATFGYIYLWGIAGFQAISGAVLKATKIPESVIPGPDEKIKINNAYTAGQLGPVAAKVKEVADTFKAFIAQEWIPQSVEITGTADSVPFKAGYNETKFKAQYGIGTEVGADKLPKVYEGAGEEGEYDKTNYTSSANAWLAYTRGQYFYDELVKQVPELQNVPVTIKGMIDLSEAGTRTIFGKIQLKKGDIIKPATEVISLVGGSAASSTDLSKYAKCIVYYPDWLSNWYDYDFNWGGSQY